MRYKIDKNNYIDEVYFNCHSGTCTEYTGTIPDGYDSLEEWAENANIRAYKIAEGNLVLDVSRDEELTKQYEQDEIDNSCVTHKELYGLIQGQENIQDINDSPYTKANATGKVIKIDNAKRVHPRVKLTNIECGDTVITWDGDMTGREHYDYFYKVSDYTPSQENLFGQTVEMMGETFVLDNIHSLDGKNFGASSSSITTFPLLVIVVTETNDEFPMSPGAYFFRWQGAYYVSKLTISCEKSIKLVTTGKNMLPNEAYSQTISGIDFTQNADRSITLNGTSTNAIEYNIAGTSTNTSPFLCLKKNQEYCLSSVGANIKMYHYNGSERTEVYSGNGGIIEYTDSDKLVTQITLEIPTNTTFNNVTIYPQLEYGSTTSEYETYNSKALSFDYSEYIEEGLYPSDNLYPSDDLYPAGTTISYILIEGGSVIACINGQEVYLAEGNAGIFEGNNTIYTFQDTNVEVDYCVKGLELEGTVTKNNNFKVKDDGSIEAYNGYFHGGVIELLDDGDGANLSIRNKNNNNESAYFGSHGFHVETTENNTLTTIGVSQRSRGNETDRGIYVSRLKKESSTEDVIDIYSDEISFSKLFNGEGTKGTVINYNSVKSKTFDNSSLEEAKKNINKINEGLNLIKNTDIYSYNYKEENDDDKKHIGLVIGENYNTPEEVMNKEKTGIDLYSMISVAWQSIKELNETVEKLENKLKELESDNSGKN